MPTLKNLPEQIRELNDIEKSWRSKNWKNTIFKQYNSIDQLMKNRSSDVKRQKEKGSN